MKNKIGFSILKFLIILFFHNVCFAETMLIPYSFGKDEKYFYVKDEYLLEKSCLEHNCEAVKSMKILSSDGKELSSEDFRGGKNPKSVYCTKLLKGSSVFGISKNGVKKLFCLLKDGSIIGYF